MEREGEGRRVRERVVQYVERKIERGRERKDQGKERAKVRDDGRSVTHDVDPVWGGEAIEKIEGERCRKGGMEHCKTGLKDLPSQISFFLFSEKLLHI